MRRSFESDNQANEHTLKMGLSLFIFQSDWGWDKNDHHSDQANKHNLKYEFVFLFLFESASAGLVDIQKLFTDCVCAHLLKRKNGWDINVDFIPMMYKGEWFKFVDWHNDKYLYSALEQVTAVAKNRFG